VNGKVRSEHIGNTLSYYIERNKEKGRRGSACIMDFAYRYNGSEYLMEKRCRENRDSNLDGRYGAGAKVRKDCVAKIPQSGDGVRREWH